MKCTKCEQKTVKHSYHNICLPCAKQNEICPKCGKKKEIVEVKPSREELIKLDEEFKTILKMIPERKQNTDTNGGDGKNKHEDKTDPKGREDLLTKLKSLATTEGEDDNFNSDTDIEKR
ncbi:Uncharacterized protein C9orf85-like protein [Lasius niger]|uniref:Uncharacterized protein C9orf85-like protein n=1 Tax=Lasius niger TaxID=67767 RepID=A0A0J7MWA4_LASNI|nr:Uncharacterized protein C9orf85-like protein [Lasius niger]